MNTQEAKTILIALLGTRVSSWLHGMRFMWLLRFCDRVLDAEIRFLRQFLKEGDVAVDVGANGADWTYHLSKVVGRRGCVFAFEADPYYARATECAVRFLGLRQASVFRFGLSNVNERVPLRVIDESGLRASGLGHVDLSARMGDADVCMVSLRTLDSLLPDHQELRKTALIKLDVEGYELFVLQGAQSMIAEARPLIIVETGAFAQQGYSGTDLTRYLREAGYHPYAIARGDRLVPTNDALEVEDPLSINRIFVPTERLKVLGLA